MTPTRRRPRTWIVVALLSGFVIVLGHEQRTLHLTVAEQMTWECTDLSHLFPLRTDQSSAPVIVLNFVSAPEERDWQGDPNGSLCRSLQQQGKPEVTLVSDVWGDRWHGWYGFSELTINGIAFPAYPPLGGFGGGELQHPEPYAQAFDSVYNRSLEKRVHASRGPLSLK